MKTENISQYPSIADHNIIHYINNGSMEESNVSLTEIIEDQRLIDQMMGDAADLNIQI